MPQVAPAPAEIRAEKEVAPMHSQQENRKHANIIVPAIPLFGVAVLLGLAAMIQPTGPAAAAMLSAEIALGGVSLYTLWPKNR